MDKKDGEEGLTQEGVKRQVGMEIVDKLQMDEVSWRQKARERWIKEGSKNTKFFHFLAIYRRRHNYVEELKIEERSIQVNESLGEELKPVIRS